MIADNCAIYVNEIFNNSADHNGLILVLGAIFFSFQIYGDFSGYADIAIGISRLLGFRLMQNFAFPYFSRDVAEFWRRWHISLSTWFRDYVYFPLGGSRGSKWQTIRNMIIVFLVSGFWHGANWTFLVWGFINAIFVLPFILAKKNKDCRIVDEGRVLPRVKSLLQIAISFAIIAFTWIFFRAENLTHAINYIEGIFSMPSSFLSLGTYIRYKMVILLILVFVVIEWFGREGTYALENIGLKWPKSLRMFFYNLLIVFIYLFSGTQQEFIYFQF